MTDEDADLRGEVATMIDALLSARRPGPTARPTFGPDAPGSGPHEALLLTAQRREVAGVAPRTVSGADAALMLLGEGAYGREPTARQ